MSPKVKPYSFKKKFAEIQKKPEVIQKKKEDEKEDHEQRSVLQARIGVCVDALMLAMDKEELKFSRSIAFEYKYFPLIKKEVDRILKEYPDIEDYMFISIPHHRCLNLQYDHKLASEFDFSNPYKPNFDFYTITFKYDSME